MFELRRGMSVRVAGTIALATIAVLLLLSATAAAKRPAAAKGPAAPAAPAAGPGACAAATVIPSSLSLRKAAADAVLCLVNIERTSRGLAAVVASPQLGKAAGAHSTDMVRRGYFDHVTPSGQDLRKRVARTGYLRGARRPALGETIAWGSDLYATPAELVKDLMNSAAHRAIITDRRYRDVGVGLALGAPLEGMGDGATLALNFGRR